MNEQLTDNEKKLLLLIAREALERSVRQQVLPPLERGKLTPLLLADGASFVTLHKHGHLRGCIGSLEPHQALADDVRERAVQAALEDYRFPPVQPNELPQIAIEISRLTQPAALDYVSADDLLLKLNAGLDGVILRDGSRRSTFLPQVWQQIPGKVEFLSQLCAKMNAPRDLWRRKHLEVLIYRVEEFHE